MGLWMGNLKEADCVPNSKRSLFLSSGVLVASWIVASTWLLLTTPSIDYFIQDADGGFFITGAWLSRTVGRWPQIDVLSSYGPLSFELRALIQSTVGDRPVAEIATAVIGYGTAFTAFFVAVRVISGSNSFAALLFVVALLCLPRYYKFFVVLVPALIGWAGVRYVEDPRLLRAAALGAVAGLAVLFRHDYGLFACIVASAALITTSDARHGRMISFAIVTAAGFVVLLPWLALLTSRGALVQHLIDLATVTYSYNGGLGLPHPLLHYDIPQLSFQYALVYALPITAAMAAWSTRRTLDRRTYASTVVVVVTAAVFLTQSMHRSDFGHLLQTIAAALLALAIVWRLASGRTLRVLAFAMAVGVGTMGIANRTYPIRAPSEIAALIDTASASRSEIVRRFVGSSPEASIAEVLQLLQCLPVGRNVAIYPFAPQLAYFANRHFAGDTLLIAPGYFQSLTHQSRMISALDRDVPIAVLWNEKQAFDNRPERNTTSTHALLYQHVRSTRHPVAMVGGYTLFVEKEDMDGPSRHCWQS